MAQPDATSSVTLRDYVNVVWLRKWLVVVDENGKPLGLVDRQILLEAVISVYEKD